MNNTITVKKARVDHQFKRAAMFGLDARIALAIFGALSVISGAALYSAIKTAKTEQWRQYFEEFIKSTEQYYLDNGKQTPIYLTSTYETYISDLAVNRENLSTWKGPYLSSTYAINNYIRDNMTAKLHTIGAMSIFLRQSSTWTQMNDFTADEFCVAGSADCSEWLNLSAGNASATPYILSLFKDLDALVDNSDGALAGKVRYNTAGVDYIMYQGLPRKR